MQFALCSFRVPGRQCDYTENAFGSFDREGIYQACLLDVESPKDFDITF